MRNREEHFTYSKVMNWVALDRGIRLAEKRAHCCPSCKFQTASQKCSSIPSVDAHNAQQKLGSSFAKLGCLRFLASAKVKE
jgi:hypothetical protein